MSQMLFRAIAPVENNGCIFHAQNMNDLDQLIKKSEFGGEFIIQRYNTQKHCFEFVKKQTYVGNGQ